MYTAIILVLAALTLYFIFTGIQKTKRIRIAIGIAIGVLSIIFFNVLDFWGDMLWFDALGYSDRFWVYTIAQSGFGLLGAVLSWLIMVVLTYGIQKERKYLRIFSSAFGFIVGGIWGYANWDVILRFWNRVPANISEPILHLDAGFYLFTLPLLRSLYTLLILLTVISLAIVFFISFFRISPEGNVSLDLYGYLSNANSKLFNNIILSSAVCILLLAFNFYLSRFELMFSSLGVVHGPGWTDANIILPAYWILIVLLTVFALLLLVKPLRKVLQRFYVKSGIRSAGSLPVFLGSIAATIFAVWFILLSVVPSLFQWLRVEPNEITLEKPYIQNNITMTRYGFNLQHIEEREFPATENFSKALADSNQATLKNIRLWDYRALDDVYKQFQEIRLYYEFKDVDIDRYVVNGEYRQVMVSAREMNSSNLPAESQTFVNRRFKYTHGYGITMSTVSDFTPDGLPDMLIKDIPPVSKYPDLAVKRPQIYYGELPNPHVIVNTTEQEFDYPSGEDNVYNRYSGKGGVQLSNIWRKFLFGWIFDGTPLFFSSYPTPESRIMFHRNIVDRVRTLAPFLTFDSDPYIVLGKDGNLYWIIDAYTTSRYFPYSEPDQHGINYIRNSVKVVVDAFNGSVDFYMYDENDPIIKVWSNIYPGLFKKKEQMPADLQDHVRYPVDMFLAQGLVYAKYHMTDPAVFYNQEDLWIRATEKYYNNVQPVAPYYIMWQRPGEEKLQFVLMLPFTPKNRQVSIGWIAGMCDPENYGELIAYQFPKERRVLGPQQVETKIDQDSFLSGQLSLWNQHGSQVIRGNMLAIPIGKTLLYVEPIYLEAETAAYPELRLVAVMHNDKLSYAKSFDEALQGLYGNAPAKPLNLETQSQAQPPARETSMANQIRQANDAFENYLKLQGQKKFEEAAKELSRLQKLLEDLSKNSGK
jgi:uncharacterized membrane protein (UPF0182 family)